MNPITSKKYTTIRTMETITNERKIFSVNWIADNDNHCN
jgi:hypothetical protein